MKCPPSPVYGDTMTTEEAAPAAEEAEMPEVPVTFSGREIFCHMPTPEQLLVWDRTVRNLTEAPPDESWTGSQVMVNRADIEWLDDQFLDRKLTFKDLAPLITLVVDAFADAAEQANATSNRESRRATAAKKTPKKATRKKAS